MPRRKKLGPMLIKLVLMAEKLMNTREQVQYHIAIWSHAAAVVLLRYRKGNREKRGPTRINIAYHGRSRSTEGRIQDNGAAHAAFEDATPLLL
jgi:hypothetical protein